MWVVIASPDAGFANRWRLLYLHGFPTKRFTLDLVVKIQSYTNSKSLTLIFKIYSSFFF